jgi:hypothetical protein
MCTVYRLSHQELQSYPMFLFQAVAMKFMSKQWCGKKIGKRQRKVHNWVFSVWDFCFCQAHQIHLQIFQCPISSNCHLWSNACPQKLRFFGFCAMKFVIFSYHAYGKITLVVPVFGSLGHLNVHLFSSILVALVEWPKHIQFKDLL